MAYMNQEKKAKIQAALKLAIPKSWKWSLSVHHHSTIILTIKSAPVDIIGKYVSKRCSEDVARYAIKDSYVDINHYHYKDHFDGELLAIFNKIVAAMNLDNHDNSDISTDYFDVGHYVNIQVGKWDKPFVVA